MGEGVRDHDDATREGRACRVRDHDDAAREGRACRVRAPAPVHTGGTRSVAPLPPPARGAVEPAASEAKDGRLTSR